MTGDFCVFKSLRLSVNGERLMRFQSKTSVFKFLRRSARADGVLDYNQSISQSIIDNYSIKTRVINQDLIQNL